MGVKKGGGKSYDHTGERRMTRIVQKRMWRKEK